MIKDYTWFKNYPEGVNYEIDPNKYTSVKELFDVSISKYGDLPAYENFKKIISYRELDTLSLKFADYLQNKLHLRKGDRIALQMPNLLQYPVALFGSLRAGLIVVNTNPLYTPREMEHQLKDSGADAIVILANFASNLQKIQPRLKLKHIIVTEIGDLLGSFKGGVVNWVVRNIKKMVPPYEIPGHIKFKEVIQTGKPERFKDVKVSGDDIAFLQYTGGTTGVAKGAILTHRNVVSNMEQISEWMKPKLKEREETIITALPLYHIFALTVNCLSFFKIGAKNVLITNPRDMPAFIKELKRHPFTIFTGVNTLFNGLLNQQSFKEVDFSYLKVSVGGGMAVQNVVADRWKKATGNPLVEGYGLTETSPVVSCNPIDGTERIGTIGLPLPSTEVKVMDEDGNEVAMGENGEICVKGPQVMSGYWQNKHETDLVFNRGWFKTGDIGCLNEDGYFKIVDRKKEMINVSGFNVYPNEIEAIIMEHPKVQEVGAVGVPDDRSNEVVKVFVVKKDPSLTEEELREFCKEHMTAYKRPKQIEFRDALPKSNIGKILRRLLVEEKESA